MPDTEPWDVVAAVCDGTATGVFEVEDPLAVAAQLAGRPGVSVVAPADLPSAMAGVRVGLAALLVERARRAEQALAAPTSPGATTDAGADHLDADRQAVRFALLILLFALPAGLTVYAVDGLVLAAALPAAALVGLGLVVLAHRRPVPTVADPERAEPEAPPTLVNVDDAPAVRAAEAHLRRQLAAWKLTWWERDLSVPALDRWSPTLAGASTAGTVVVVDDDPIFDEDAGAATPPAVRVVVLRART